MRDRLCDLFQQDGSRAAATLVALYARPDDIEPPEFFLGEWLGDVLERTGVGAKDGWGSPPLFPILRALENR